MAGYVPLFDSIATGTLYGRWPDIGLWPIVLALSDRAGRLDVTPQYLAGVTGLPVSDVIACMKRFCEADPYSRSKESDGSRLRLIDEHRDWGWIVINHGKYAEKARLMNKDQKRKEQASESPRFSPVSPEPPRTSPVSHDLTLSSSSSSSSSSKRGKKASTPFPDGYALSDEMRAKVLTKFPDADPDAMFEQFRDYHLAHAKTSANWAASWGTWVRNAEKFDYPKMRSTVRKWD